MSVLNQILQGVLLGGYYALLACGLSFMFGVMPRFPSATAITDSACGNGRACPWICPN